MASVFTQSNRQPSFHRLCSHRRIVLTRWAQRAPESGGEQARAWFQRAAPGDPGAAGLGRPDTAHLCQVPVCCCCRSSLRDAFPCMVVCSMWPPGEPHHPAFSHLHSPLLLNLAGSVTHFNQQMVAIVAFAGLMKP